MKARGYRQSQGDHTLFIKHSKKGKMAIFIVYVNDIIVIGDDNEEIWELNNKMSQAFEIKDLRNLKYFLSIKVARSKHEIFISQQKYVLDLLNETRMLGGRPTSALIEANLKLRISKENGWVNKGRYQWLVGKLIYLSHTRLDIAFDVS